MINSREGCIAHFNSLGVYISVFNFNNLGCLHFYKSSLNLLWISENLLSLCIIWGPIHIVLKEWGLRIFQAPSPRGGVLLPLLWTIVVDSLFYKLSDAGFEVQGYADDLDIVVRGKFDSIIHDRMIVAMDTVSGWCQEHGLSVNPSKAVLVPFTKRRRFLYDPS